MANQLRQIAKLLKALEKQGCTVIQTKKGVQVRFPDGVSGLVIHRTASDNRAVKNTEAQITRAGLTVPPGIRW